MPMDNQIKRFYRTNDDKKIAGVCGGLGRYFNADPIFFRILFVVLTLCAGGGLLIYLLMWIFTSQQ